MTTYSEKCSRGIYEVPVGAYQTLVEIIHNWYKIQQLKRNLRQERKQLVGLSEVLLKDIGIDRLTAEHEARRDDIPVERR